MTWLSDRSIVLCLVAVALGLGPGNLQVLAETSSPWVEGHKTKARLFAGDLDGAGMGFIEIELAPGWKTYWRNPGDAGGLPPSFDWTGSRNLAGATVLYPVPTRMTDKSGDTIGYKGGVIFPVELKREAADQAVSLKLALQYGICKEVCVPVELALELDVPAGDLEPVDEAARQAVSEVPRRAEKALPDDPQLARADGALTGDQPRIVIEGTFPGDAAAAEVFLDAPGGVFVPHPVRTGDLGGGRLVFEAVLDPNAGLDGLAGKEITATLVGSAGAAEATFSLK